jgi:protocatechuate 3,4-dioxygenase beta subunit
MAEEKKRISPLLIAGIGAGAAIATGAALYFITRAKVAPPPGGAFLYGQVTDAETGDPIEGVKISLNGLITHTDSNGAYAFDGVEPGQYVVEFSKDGYEALVY